MKSESLDQKIAIVAGSGDMPGHALRALEQSGRSAVVLGIRETGALNPGADDFESISLGQAAKLLGFFKDRDVRQILILGKLDKGLHFADLEFDELALSLLQQMPGRADMNLFKLISDWMQREGLSILPQTAALTPLLCTEGLLGEHPVGDRSRDVEYALKLARQIANMDIGQSVAVREGICIAVEAFEHTDMMIKRAGELAGPNVVVAKVPRPNQDPRFDVPTIGPDTIRNLVDIGASGIALEADSVFVLEKEEVVRLADQGGIFAVGVPGFGG